MNREKNNQIVVEFYPPYSDIISDEISTDEALSPIQVRLDTEYVMEGMQRNWRFWKNRRIPRLISSSHLRR